MRRSSRSRSRERVPWKHDSVEVGGAGAPEGGTGTRMLQLAFQRAMVQGRGTGLSSEPLGRGLRSAGCGPRLLSPSAIDLAPLFGGKGVRVLKVVVDGGHGHFWNYGGLGRRWFDLDGALAGTRCPARTWSETRWPQKLTVSRSGWRENSNVELLHR
jgi:hypothetical protein